MLKNMEGPLGAVGHFPKRTGSKSGFADTTEAVRISSISPDDPKERLYNFELAGFACLRHEGAIDSTAS